MTDPHHIALSARTQIQFKAAATPTLITVTHPDQLPGALAQRERPVVIGYDERRFSMLAYWQEARLWFIAALSTAATLTESGFGDTAPSLAGQIDEGKAVIVAAVLSSRSSWWSVLLSPIVLARSVFPSRGYRLPPEWEARKRCPGKKRRLKWLHQAWLELRSRCQARARPQGSKSNLRTAGRSRCTSRSAAPRNRQLQDRRSGCHTNIRRLCGPM